MVNNLVVCGGTFDHLHKGHEEFLKYAFSVGKKVIVGITSDKFVRRWKVDDRSWKQTEIFEERKRAVLEFIKKERVLNGIGIVKIDDLFGSTLSKDLLIDAIIVSGETKKNAEIINQKRQGLGLTPLKILIAPLVNAEDGRPIASSRIRNGEINRIGRQYVKPIWLKKNLILPVRLRKEFRKPFDVLDIDVLKHQDQFPLIVSVGDVTTKKFNQLSVGQKISVVDFKVARKKVFSSFLSLGFCGGEKIITAVNPASYVTHDLFSKILDIFKSGSGKRIILKVTGEEDLAVLPLILATPLGTIIYYGQPSLNSASFEGQEGIVRIVVSEQSKDKAYDLASKLKPI